MKTKTNTKTFWLMNAGFILLFIVLVSILSGIQANAVVEYNDSNTI